jgi:hypothetical protein
MTRSLRPLDSERDTGRQPIVDRVGVECGPRDRSGTLDPRGFIRDTAAMAR